MTETYFDFRWSNVPATSGQKCGWTDVVDKAVIEEVLRLSTQFPDNAPESLTALFFARAIEALDRL